MLLSEIAKLISGKLEGEDIEISGISNLDIQAGGTIGYAENKRALGIMANSPVSALILPPDLEYGGKPVIRVANPKLAFSAVLDVFSPYESYPVKIYPNSHIESGARIGKNVTVMPFAVIMDRAEIGDGSLVYSHVFIGKDVKIGKGCVIKSGVKIDDRTVIGDHVIINHNSVIGGDGFGYIQDEGMNKKVPQIGRIVIGDHTEIGACVTVDRATIGETVIGKDVKIDNLVQIAHNTKIGDHSILMSQVGIAGSTRLGERCILTGQVGVADHLNIGDNVVIMSKSGVEKRKIDSNSILMGIPAREIMHQRRIYAALDRLPDMVKDIRELKKNSQNGK